VTTASIPFNAFTGIYGVTLGNSPLQVSKTNNGYDWNVSTYGIVSSNGASYIQPSVDDATHYTSNNKPYVLANPLTFRVHHHRGAITPISSNVLSFGYKAASAATYGMSFANLVDQFIVDSETKTYYLQPDASGNPIRTGYAGVLPFSNTNAIASVDYTFTSTTPTTITFERAFVEQPLIFIVSTTEGPYQPQMAIIWVAHLCMLGLKTAVADILAHQSLLLEVHQQLLTLWVLAVDGANGVMTAEQLGHSGILL
jgi:hypothetical protein